MSGPTDTPSAATGDGRPHRLLIVGGGVAGLDIASHLARVGEGRIEVTLIDREPAYVWKPMLHMIAAGTANAQVQQTAYIAQAHDRGFFYRPGQAVRIDRAARCVEIAPVEVDGREALPAEKAAYDTLVLAVGSGANDFGTPGVAAHCFAIDGRRDALTFNDRLRLEMLKTAAARGTLTIGIVGGGATGVELAAELVRLAQIAQSYGLAGETGRVRVTLLEAGSRLLAGFPEQVARAVADKLAQLGVEVRTGAHVSSVEEEGFRLQSGELVAASLRVWAAGVRAPPLLDTLEGLERAKDGRLVVGPTLATPGDPRIFAAGDCASPKLSGRAESTPTTAQAAHQMALYLCRHLPALVEGRQAPPFAYHDFGALVSLGGYDAYGTLGRVGALDGGFLRGRVAELGHTLLYRSYQARLHGFWRGGLLWLSDMLASYARPAARLA